MEDQSTIVAEPGVIYPRYREALDTYLDELRRGCTEFKVDYRLVMADEDYEKVLADFLLARMRT
jgi:hypothetical protein